MNPIASSAPTRLESQITDASMGIKSTSSSHMSICGDCADEPFLRAKIQKVGKEKTCSYCSCLEKSISLKSLASWVERALQTHYMRNDDYSEDSPGTPISEVIACIAGLEMDAAEQIRSILEYRFKSKSRFGALGDTPFSPHVRYVKQSLGSYENDVIWNDFKTSIKEESRFFNKAAADSLRCVFGINKAKSTAKHSLTPMIVFPGSEFGSYYRARVFKTLKEVEDALKNPEKELGPPPTEKAAAGRMNALGIPVFYGAFKPDTALAEVRPPVGGFVLLGRFRIQRDVRLLDFDQMIANPPRGSVFDPEFEERSEWFRFLNRFEDEITRPVQPGDEASSYLPTQAVADFLANLGEVSLDGIVFRSGQSPGGRNVVLFNKSSRVKYPSPKELCHRRVQVWLDQIGQQHEDAVMVIEGEEPSNDSGSSEGGADHDSRPVTLAFDKNSIELHQVKEVKVCTTTEKITWLRR